MSMIEQFLGVAPRRFLADTWPEHHQVHHGDLRRLPWLDYLPELASIADYAEHLSATDTVALIYPNDARDESAAKPVPAWQFGGWMTQQPMFSVCPAEASSPGLSSPLRQLRNELGLSELSTARSIVYGSFGGPAAAWHWDAGANFVLQLAGSKRWNIAPNAAISNPPDRYSTLMRTWPDRLAHHVVDDPPTSGPRTWETIELTAGSALFLPAGYWHATESDGESLALNFTYGTPDRSQVLCRYISRVFQSDPRWRRLAQRPLLSDDRGDAEFDLLIGELVEHLGVRSSADVFDGLVEFDHHDDTPSSPRSSRRSSAKSPTSPNT
jgi:ribosomal protein L16 Arg81 hydroxylase